MRLRGEIGVELRGVVRGEAKVLNAHELRPAETEGAVGVARLPLTWKKEHCFSILMLHAGHALAGHDRDVELLLLGRMGVQPQANRVGRGFDLGSRGPLLEQVGDRVEVRGVEHLRLRKRQLEHGIVRHVIPVDQFFDDVRVDAKGQDAGDDLHLEPMIGGQTLQLRNPVEMLLVEDAEAGGLGRGRYCDRRLFYGLEDSSGVVQHMMSTFPQSRLQFGPAGKAVRPGEVGGTV